MEDPNRPGRSLKPPKRPNPRPTALLWKIWSGIRGKISRAKMANSEYVFNARGSAYRQWAPAEQYKRLIENELQRCGWRTKTVRVRTFADGEEIRFYADIAGLRGLDPAAVLRVLMGWRSAETTNDPLPSHCGYQIVLRELSKLEERVERGIFVDGKKAAAVPARLATNVVEEPREAMA